MSVRPFLFSCLKWPWGSSPLSALSFFSTTGPAKALASVSSTAKDRRPAACCYTAHHHPHPPRSLAYLGKQGAWWEKSLNFYKVVTTVGLCVIKPKCCFTPTELRWGKNSLDCQLRKFYPRKRGWELGVCQIRKCELTDGELKKRRKKKKNGTEATGKRGRGRE